MRQMIRHNLIRFNYVALLALLGGLLLPLCASAANYDFEYDGLYYKVTGANTVSVFHYPNGNSSALPSELTIPETVENAGMTYTVTEVANEAFRYRNTLKSVHLPSSIKAIGHSAFLRCTALTLIDIPSSIRTIGHSAFCECTALTSIDLPEGITKVGALCFARCTALTSIDIPEGTTEVGAHCFSGCTALTHIKLPGTLTEISESLFDSCRSLTSVELSPSSVSAVGASAFRWCVNLTDIRLPETVRSIGHSAFYGCTKLQSFEIPPLVTKVEMTTFQDCSSLSSLVIPASVTTIGEYAFSGCSQLPVVRMPSVSAIGEKAFYNCTQLAEIEFSDSLSSVGLMAFDGTAWYDNQSDGLIYAGLMAYRFKGTPSQGGSVVVKPGTKGIAENCFYGCTGLTAIELPQSISAIGGTAFAQCADLTSIDLPDAVTRIEMGCFRGCTSLASVKLPAGLTAIMPEAFQGCGSLTAVQLPASLSQILHHAFADCSSLESVILPSSLTTVEMSVFENCAALKSVTIPNSVTAIKGRAFGNCTGLTEIDIPNSVRSLGGFEGCTGLTEVEIPNSVVLLAAFDGCTGLTEVTIPNSVQHLSGFASCTGLTRIDIPNSVVSIGMWAFDGCTGLTEVTIPNSVVNLDGFSRCSNLRRVDIAGSVSVLGENAFTGCVALEEIICRRPTPPKAYEAHYEDQGTTFVPGTFDGIDKDSCVIRVPQGSVEGYQSATGWGEFSHFLPIDDGDVVGDVNGDGVVDIADVNGLINDLLGKGDFMVTVNGASLRMNRVEGGTFVMGRHPDEDLDVDFTCMPHEVTVSTYAMAVTELTCGLWDAVMGTDSGAEQRYKPHVASWNQAQEFIGRLNTMTGLQFRLPTEAEWEYAARGGAKSQGYIFSGGNRSDLVGWCYIEDYQWGYVENVAQLLPNELGLYDMSGNVWEWCQDYWEDNPSTEPQVNPTGPETGTWRVIRGGSCACDEGNASCVYSRLYGEPDRAYFTNEPIGIRLAMDYTPELYNRACDVTGDGRVDIADVNAVINIMLGHADYDVPTGNPGHDTDPGQ